MKVGKIIRSEAVLLIFLNKAWQRLWVPILELPKSILILN